MVAWNKFQSEIEIVYTLNTNRAAGIYSCVHPSSEFKILTKFHMLHILTYLHSPIPTEQVYHVTLPQEMPAAQSEAILKLSSRDHVVVIAPTTGSKLLEISYKQIRRMGNMDVCSSDIIWFEMCGKGHEPDQFHFFIVPSGLQTTHLVLRELKMATECATGALFITEESNGIDLSFISRSHYGCPEFPLAVRNKSLQSGFRLITHTSIFAEERRSSKTKLQHTFDSTPNLSLEDFSHVKQRRLTNQCVHPLMTSRRHNGIALDQFRSNGSYSSSSHLSGSRSGSGELSDSGVINDVFDGGSTTSIPLPLGYSNADHLPSTRPADYSNSSPPQVPPRSQVSLQHDREAFA